MTEFSLAPKYAREQVRHLSEIGRYRVPTVLLLVGWLSLVAIIAFTAFLVFVPWVQTVSGSGKIVALEPSDREQDISALVPGRIAEWYVREGSQVEAGDPVARIADIDPQLIARLESQLTVARERLATTRAAADTARLDQERKATLFEDGLVSRLDFEQAQIRLRELEAQAQSAAEAVAQAEVGLSRESSQMVRAPRSGTVTRVTAGGTATFVKAGDPLARFAPSGIQRAVEIYVDGRDAALVSVGRPVRLQFEAWPAIQFSGWPAVAIGTFAAQVTFVDPLARADGRFRVVVSELESEPWPDDHLLRLGTKARGWILLDEVSVGYELWRQLNNFPPEFVQGSPATETIQ